MNKLKKRQQDMSTESKLSIRSPRQLNDNQ